MDNPRTPCRSVRQSWQEAVDIIGFGRYKFQPETLGVWDKDEDRAMRRPGNPARGVGEMGRIYELVADDGEKCSLRVMDLLKGVRMGRDPRYLKTPAPKTSPTRKPMKNVPPGEFEYWKAVEDANRFMENYGKPPKQYSDIVNQKTKQSKNRKLRWAT